MLVLVVGVSIAASLGACGSPQRAAIKDGSRGEPEAAEVDPRERYSSERDSSERAERTETDAPPAPPEDDGDPEAEQAYDYTRESLGELTFELDAVGVQSVLGAPSEKSPVAEEEASGSYVTTWEWPKQGVEIRLSSENARGPFRIDSIAARAPSRLRTAKGIGLGSTPAAIQEAYGREQTRVDESSVLVGSPYGGVHFELEGGKVSAIFIGAGAE